MIGVGGLALAKLRLGRHGTGSEGRAMLTRTCDKEIIPAVRARATGGRETIHLCHGRLLFGNCPYLSAPPLIPPLPTPIYSSRFRSDRNRLPLPNRS